MNNYKKYGEYSAERCSRGETVKTAIAFFCDRCRCRSAAFAVARSPIRPRSDRFDDARRELGEQTSRLRRRTAERGAGAGKGASD